MALSNIKSRVGRNYSVRPHPKSLSQAGRDFEMVQLPFSLFGRRGWGMSAAYSLSSYGKSFY